MIGSRCLDFRKEDDGKVTIKRPNSSGRAKVPRCLNAKAPVLQLSSVFSYRFQEFSAALLFASFLHSKLTVSPSRHLFHQNQSKLPSNRPLTYFHLYYLITPMGNSEAGPYTTIPRDFPIQKYLNQGLNQNQILQVKYAFDSYEPEDGCIDLSRLKPAGGQAQSKEKIEKYLGKKEKMNFDEFFAMSKEVLQEENKKYGQLNIDNNEMEASCLFCPYAVDKNK